MGKTRIWPEFGWNSVRVELEIVDDTGCSNLFSRHSVIGVLDFGAQGCPDESRLGSERARYLGKNTQNIGAQKLAKNLSTVRQTDQISTSLHKFSYSF